MNYRGAKVNITGEVTSKELHSAWLQLQNLKGRGQNYFRGENCKIVSLPSGDVINLVGRFPKEKEKEKPEEKKQVVLIPVEVVCFAYDVGDTENYSGNHVLCGFSPFLFIENYYNAVVSSGDPLLPVVTISGNDLELVSSSYTLSSWAQFGTEVTGEDYLFICNGEESTINFGFALELFYSPVMKGSTDYSEIPNLTPIKVKNSYFVDITVGYKDQYDTVIYLNASSYHRSVTMKGFTGGTGEFGSGGLEDITYHIAYADPYYDALMEIYNLPTIEEEDLGNPISTWRMYNHSIYSGIADLDLNLAPGVSGGSESYYIYVKYFLHPDLPGRLVHRNTGMSINSWYATDPSYWGNDGITYLRINYPDIFYKDRVITPVLGVPSSYSYLNTQRSKIKTSDSVYTVYVYAQGIPPVYNTNREIVTSDISNTLYVKINDTVVYSNTVGTKTVEMYQNDIYIVEGTFISIITFVIDGSYEKVITRQNTDGSYTRLSGPLDSVYPFLRIVKTTILVEKEI